MREIPEGLIDGVRRICDCYCSRGTPDVVIKETITFILSAVRDGGLELPDEIGRGKGYADTKGYDSGFAGQKDVELEIDEHTVRRSQVYDGDRLDFIALHKEEKK